jgi:hypothetical protein
MIGAAHSKASDSARRLLSTMRHRYPCAIPVRSANCVTFVTERPRGADRGEGVGQPARVPVRTLGVPSTAGDHALLAGIRAHLGFSPGAKPPVGWRRCADCLSIATSGCDSAQHRCAWVLFVRFRRPHPKPCRAAATATSPAEPCASGTGAMAASKPSCCTAASAWAERISLHRGRRPALRKLRMAVDSKWMIGKFVLYGTANGSRATLLLRIADHPVFTACPAMARQSWR